VYSAAEHELFKLTQLLGGDHVMRQSFLLWLHGLAAAFIGGAANSIAAMGLKPDAFNLGAQWRSTASFAVFSGVISAVFYLKASPVPPTPKPEDTK
jgi:hypothetical protein